MGLYGEEGARPSGGPGPAETEHQMRVSQNVRGPWGCRLYCRLFYLEVPEWYANFGNVHWKTKSELGLYRSFHRKNKDYTIMDECAGKEGFSSCNPKP